MIEVSTCPSCYAEQADLTLCNRCTAALRSSLRRVLPAPGVILPVGRQSLPWEDQSGEWTGIDDQLTMSLARISRRGSRNGGRSTTQPLPYDPGASDAIAALRNVLATWVRVLEADGQDWPADTLPGMAQWLLDRMTRIRQHEAAGQIKSDIMGAIGRAMRMIDAPASSLLVGRCPVCGKGEVYAHQGAEVGLCRLCDAVVADVQGRRSSLLARAEDRLATKEQILKAIPSMYGVDVTDTRFRKWLSRGRIAPLGCDPATREPHYRVGDVLDVANGERARSVAS